MPSPPIHPRRPIRPVQPVIPDGSISPPSVREASPLLLLPMRLEYRVIKRASSPDVIQTEAEIKELQQVVADAPSGDVKALEKMRIKISSLRKKKFTSKKPSLSENKEIWFRWYPDEAFSEKGIALITDDEKALLNEFNTSAGDRSHQWWEAENHQALSESWQKFAGAVGPYRAIHLLRTQGQPGDSKWESHIGRIVALPNRVKLFGVFGEKLELLGEGSDIPKNQSEERSEVSYTYEAIDPGGWLTDFAKALEIGMGLKLTKKENVEKALKADWIIAVGIYGGSATGEIETLLRDRIANGDFEFLPQDSPTNNSAANTSILMNPRYDMNSFLSIASENEAGKLKDFSKTAAGILTSALDIDEKILRQAIRASDGAIEDARSMIRVIAPALLDDSIYDTILLEGIEEKDFIDVLAGSMISRGNISPVRVGRNAYGIVTISDVNQITINGSSDTEKKIHTFLLEHAKLARNYLPEDAENYVSVLKPDDTSASEKLEEILQNNRVSVRLDVTDDDTDQAFPVMCPYVTGNKAEYTPESYLKLLRTSAIGKLPDPTNKDAVWPLLYRLARLSLEANTVVLKAKSSSGGKVRSLRDMQSLSKTENLRHRRTFSHFSVSSMGGKQPPSIPGLTPQDAKKLQITSALFKDALERLEEIAQRKDGTAQLEILMMETFDLLQHRLDVFATGMAYERLNRNRTVAKMKGLNAGYYGFLGKLREQSATGKSDGYIQAPSMPQAVTAAVLRSAFLRHRENGAFAINLRSRRARNAMTILDLLMKGISIGEALGMRAERWLHEHKLDRFIYPLRVVYPITNPDSLAGDSISIGRRVFDGLDYLEDKKNVRGTGLTKHEFKEADRGLLDQLKEKIADDLDALSDLVIAEATHQRALGAAEVANAWLQVLSGGTVPGKPEFLRTQRHGQGSSHRFLLLMENIDSVSSDNLRTMAEPNFANFIETTLAGFASASATIHIALKEDETKKTLLSVKLKADLDLSPIDLAIGGKSELEVRLQHYLFEQAIRNQTRFSSLGIQLENIIDLLLTNNITVAFDYTQDTPSVDSLLSIADALRRLFQQGRIMEPADMNAASSVLLEEYQEIQLIKEANEELRNRVNLLNQKILQDISKLDISKSKFIRDIDAITQRIVQDPNLDTALQQLYSVAEVSRRELVDLLKSLSQWSEPSSLRALTVKDAIQGTSGLNTRLDDLKQRLTERGRRLSSVYSESGTVMVGTLSEARAVRAMLITAIQGALDGDALPVLPIYERTTSLIPQIEANSAQKAEEALTQWSKHREALANANIIRKSQTHLKMYSVDYSRLAGNANTDENEAPKSYYFGVLMGSHKAVNTSPKMLGLVIDEWAEQRPSQTQLAGMAINYDTPQAKSPHCILLCIPPDEKTKIWGEDSAAKMVSEAIAWMKVRAYSTDFNPHVGSVLPAANQVPYKKENTSYLPRIPVVFMGRVIDVVEGSGIFMKNRKGFFGIQE